MESAKDPRMVESEIRRSDDLDSVSRDLLAVEEPLEIRLVYSRDGREDERSISITMRTPGNDLELAVGFLHGEGFLRDRKDLGSPDPGNAGPAACNVVRLRLGDTVKVDLRSLERHFYTTSSCGICGKASLEALRQLHDPDLPEGEPRVGRDTLARLPDTLLQAQSVFERTGGLHAAGLFDSSGRLECLREDVGRHNAVDKVIGNRVLEGHTPLRSSILMVSGRTSFEILQKALVAEIPVVVAVSAPSSLAVDVARRFGMTLVGFLREGAFNVYADRGRIR